MVTGYDMNDQRINVRFTAGQEMFIFIITGCAVN
jgi:hypothetical protein